MKRKSILINLLKELFHPKVVSRYNKLVAENKEAIRIWSDDKNQALKRGIRRNCLSFEEKKYVLSFESEIASLSRTICEKKRIRHTFERLSKSYPLGCKYFEQNYVRAGEDKLSKVASNQDTIKLLQRICLKYESLKRKYPLTLRLYEEGRLKFRGEDDTRLTIEEIVEREAEIETYENFIQKKIQEKKNAIIEKRRLEEAEKRRLEEAEKERKRRAVYKAEANEILQLLASNGIKCFYHFTSRKNLASIKSHNGLYSWFYLKSHGINIPDQGGSTLSEQLDMHYGLQDYVRLSFCKSHPMAYRKMCEGADIVVLKISLEVAVLKNTLFSDMNAADKQHAQGDSLDSLKRINFAATQREYVRRDDPDFKYRQAEIMVKTFIPLKYILNFDSFLIDELPF